jgi:hypothetical protein
MQKINQKYDDLTHTSPLFTLQSIDFQHNSDIGNCTIFFSAIPMSRIKISYKLAF